MRKSVQRPRRESRTESEPFHYSSSTLKHFFENLEHRNGGCLLDVGPIFRDNIDFLSHRVRRLYACDVLRILIENQKANLPADKYWRHLDYPPETFDGILLWNLVDRLDTPEVKGLVERCYGMMKSGGVVMLFTLGNRVSPSGQEAFVIREEFQLFARGQQYPHLPVRQRQNRDFLRLLNPFTPAKSLIYRNGIREFLFQRG